MADNKINVMQILITIDHIPASDSLGINLLYLKIKHNRGEISTLLSRVGVFSLTSRGLDFTLGTFSLLKAHFTWN